jgi:hypothetical protein
MKNPMKRKPKTSTATRKASDGPNAVAQKRRSVKLAKQSREGGDLEKVLGLIRAHPGIRPSEINRLLDRVESDGLRSTLIKRGLVRKEKDGSAIRYYPI